MKTDSLPDGQEPNDWIQPMNSPRPFHHNAGRECTGLSYGPFLGEKETDMDSQRPSIRARRVLWGAVIFLALIGVFVVVRRTAQLAHILINGYSPPAAPSDPALAQFAALDDVFARHPVLTLVHILPGLLFIVLGPLQFSSKLRERHPNWHRRVGRILLVCGIVIGMSALVMSFWMPSIGGVNQAAATTLFGLWFLFALGKAFRHILRREMRLHREWMIRAFSTGLAVATIRPIVAVFFATSPFSGLTPHEFFGTAFWIGFVLHLIAAEAWIQWTRPQAEIFPLPKQAKAFPSYSCAGFQNGSGASSSESP